MGYFFLHTKPFVINSRFATRILRDKFRCWWIRFRLWFVLSFLELFYGWKKNVLSLDVSENLSDTITTLTKIRITINFVMYKLIVRFLCFHKICSQIQKPRCSWFYPSPTMGAGVWIIIFLTFCSTTHSLSAHESISKQFLSMNSDFPTSVLP